MFECEVKLFFGGFIVIDLIEVLVFIDINFLKFIKGLDIEEIVLMINLEVVDEIVW